MSAIWLVLSAGILVVVLLLELNALPGIRFQGSGCVTAVQSEGTTTTHQPHRLVGWHPWVDPSAP